MRYDGGHKRDERLIDAFGPHVEFVPVCPEVELGLGTPREPLRLMRDGRKLRMVTVNTNIDHTDAMKGWAARRLEELAAAHLSGFVLKKDSPSCGIEGVKTYGDGSPQRDGRGLFATALLNRFPHLPVEEETRLSDPKARARFIERVLEYHQRRTRTVRVLRVTADNVAEQQDLAAVEEPLEVRLHDRPFAVIMRTPGADRHLAAGFLLAEGLVTCANDIGAVEHCRHPSHPAVHNVVNVFLVGEAAATLPAKLEERRNVLTNSSCGLCGRVTIEALRTRAVPLPVTTSITGDAVRAMPRQLRARQPLFDETGALHGAALFSPSDECVATAEDVGRHNAVDKVVGGLLLDSRLPLTGHALAVSGRASYEIVQKAWLAGVEIVCAVSAPSSLAINLAEEAGITLIGFARENGFNIYSTPGRVRL